MSTLTSLQRNALKAANKLVQRAVWKLKETEQQRETLCLGNEPYKAEAMRMLSEIGLRQQAALDKRYDQREAIQHADGCQLSNAECVKLIHESIEPMKCVA